jgi:hypothetical protein
LSIAAASHRASTSRFTLDLFGAVQRKLASPRRRTGEGQAPSQAILRTSPLSASVPARWSESWRSKLRTGTNLPAADEIASTIWRTLQLPEIAALRPRLVPEWPIYALLAGASTPTAVAGRIDAVSLEDGQASVVLDWKSDIAPTDDDVRIHYLKTTGAPRIGLHDAGHRAVGGCAAGA